MAKDGTARGGARVGAGRKPKALADKIALGKPAEILSLPQPADIEGTDVPPVKDFLKAAQKSGIDLCAEDVFRSTYTWLKERGCEKLVNTQLIEQYAMSVSRWVQCETCISEYRFLAVFCKHEIPSDNKNAISFINNLSNYKYDSKDRMKYFRLTDIYDIIS